MGTMSLWSLKKLPLEDVIEYIMENSGSSFQARMVGISADQYKKLAVPEARERLAQAISLMNEACYDDFLLEMIDE